MKVALVSEYYYPDVGGMPECVHNLALGLHDLGHEPVIVTANFESEEHDMRPAPRVERFGKSKVFFANGSISRSTVGFGLRAKLREFLHDERFDVIHLHGPQWPLLPPIAVQGAPPESTLVGTLHTYFDDSFIMRRLKQALNDLFAAMSAVTSVSESAARALMRYVEDLEYQVIPNGIDLEWLQAGTPLERFADGKVNFMFLGRLEPRNEIPRLLEAFALARRERSGLRLIMCGDGPERKQLVDMVPPDIANDVEFVGTILGDRPNYFASADVYCFTTRIGAMPISLLEAIGAGKPVIAPAIEPVRDLLVAGREGLIVPLDSVRGFADAMVSLADDHIARQEMGTAALRTAQKFGWPKIVERYVTCYEQARHRHV